MLPIDDSRNFDLPTGFGCIFVEFEAKEEAMEAKSCLNMIKFDNRLIEACYWDENMYKKGDFKMPVIKSHSERDTAYIGIENLAIDFA